MKQPFLFLALILACLFPATYCISCNSVEGNIESSSESHIATDILPDSVNFLDLVKKTDSVLVCNSKTAYAYHSGYCSGLNRCKASISKILKSDAEAQGRTPCKFCY